MATSSGRLALHGLVCATALLLALAGRYAAAPSRLPAVLPDPVAHSSSPPPPRTRQIQPRGAGSSTVFDPRVERWRPEAVTAAARIAARTGTVLDPNLLLALVAVESGGDPRARSSADALGLAQLRPAAFHDMASEAPAWFAANDPFDPSENLLAGGLYLVWCARLLGVDLSTGAGLQLALNAYNAGPSAVEQLERAAATPTLSLPAETRLHAQKVLAAYALAQASRL